jgi:adenylyltransferase/sulfurtransferase
MSGTGEFFVVGAGGLGCPALLSLAASRAARITVIDHDRVEASNLQRQVLYDVTMVGMAKATAASHQLRRRHPDLPITAETRRLSPKQADAWVAGLPRDSVVLECTDQPALKFALNDACLRHGVSLVIGAALGWTGQVLGVRAGSACYRCIYEQPPPEASLPTCESAGVVGPAVGHVGAVMASLAWGMVSSPDETAGRLLTIDLRTAQVRSLAPRPRVSCPACRAVLNAAGPTATAVSH